MITAITAPPRIAVLPWDAGLREIIFGSPTQNDRRPYQISSSLFWSGLGVTSSTAKQRIIDYERIVF